MFRTWVLPILKLVVFAAIAAALVKLAFFGGDTQGDDPTLPTGGITEPEVPAMTATIRNDVEVQATVSADAAVPIRATLAGEVRELLVAAGAPVAPDTPVARIRSESFSPEGQPVVRWETVLAGAAGTLSSLPTLTGQVVAVGEALGQVAPPTFHVSGTMSPEQQYRLLSNPTEATVAITGGPQPFTCTGLSISTPLAGADGGEAGAGAGAGAGGEGGSTTTVRCAVPGEVTVFSGLSATMTIAGGVAEDVITVPVTAVEGTTGTGKVYRLDPETGEQTPIEVTIGISDGENVEISSGLAEGDMVLLFVPGAPVDAGLEGGMMGYGG